jgi:hypothetical protein
MSSLSLIFAFHNDGPSGTCGAMFHHQYSLLRLRCMLP